MDAYVLDWLNLLVRWLHLITGIAWIGASFYFVMLDNSLSPPAKAADRERGVFGELWAVHGGGFYVSQKFLTGPKGEPLSANLHWSKWEAYTTWLSGMGLLAIIYWFGASTWLVDRSVLDISPGAGVAISIAVIVGGWLVYDGLCRLVRGRETVLAALLFVFVVAMCWALAHVFSARAAYLHVGVMLGTIMVANVFFVIIPGQKAMVADILAGREPDPAPGLAGKQRSVHNTYFTLPVLFVMISNHYPMTYGHPYGWAVLALVMLAGRADPAVFRAAPQGQREGVAPDCGVRPARRRRGGDRAARNCAGRPGGRDGAGAGRHCAALRALPCGAAAAGGLRATAEGHHARDPRADRRAGGQDRRDRRQQIHADRQPHADDRR